MTLRPSPAQETPRPSAPPRSGCPLTIIIKALNEEQNIAQAVSSALRAVQPFGGEVVLADSCSTDRTVEIAAAYPIRVVQLANARERSCGVGPQLGFQHSHGEYVYLMDGDMEIVPGFLEQALNFLAQHPEVAGVGGRLVELNMDSLEFRERALKLAQVPPGPVDRLDGGGLYRRRAVQEAGYFSDRNLHSYEELELAVRLRARGWKLWRLAIDAVTHYGHESPPLALLMRRWRSGYICGTGELLRSAMGHPWLRLVLRDQREMRLYVAVLGWWALLLGVALWPLALPQRLALLAGLVLAPVAVMALRKRSLRRGAYSVTSWCFHAAGLVRGLVHHRQPPQSRIASHIVREPEQPPGSPHGGAGPGNGSVPGSPTRRVPPSAHRS